MSLIFSQNCLGFYLSTKGNKAEYETYDKKGKPTGSYSQEILNVEPKGGNTVFTFQMIFKDKKGKESVKSDYQITCESNQITMDMTSRIPNTMMENFEAKTVSSKNLVIPNNIQQGQSLPEGTIVIDLYTRNKDGSTGAKASELEMRIFDRKVVAKENITTPAGTFECYKITEKAEIVNKPAGLPVPFRIEIDDTAWLSKKIGVVKSESYNRSGKLMGSTVLNSLKN